MDPITIAALAGIAGGGFSSFVNPFVGLATSAVSTKRQYKYQSKLLEQQYYYNKMLASSAHQMEVSDLKKAGLNPVLSATRGAQASVGLPQVGLDSGSSGSFADSAAKTVEAIGSAMQMKANLEEKQANIDYIRNLSQTEENKRANLDSQTQFNTVSAMQKDLENMYLPDYLKSKIEKNLSSAKADIMNSFSSRIIANSSAKQANILQERAKYQNMVDKANALYVGRKGIGVGESRGFNVLGVGANYNWTH